ncbi:hypothetical protein ACN4EE_01605 [Geminocystis sp. CENA526]|uniref:ParE family toxin-like protein n=1 Tax=Geminocystis sp. CENA526 TaxID=1355871 RepID=UPI003D6F2AF0
MPENISHYTSSSFWQSYYELPLKIQKIADQKYKLLKENSRHPSLKLKRIRTLWAVRVTDNYRALGVDESDGILWFWIGDHDRYEQILSDL